MGGNPQNTMRANCGTQLDIYLVTNYIYIRVHNTPIHIHRLSLLIIIISLTSYYACTVPPGGRGPGSPGWSKPVYLRFELFTLLPCACSLRSWSQTKPQSWFEPVPRSESRISGHGFFLLSMVWHPILILLYILPLYLAGIVNVQQAVHCLASTCKVLQY